MNSTAMILYFLDIYVAKKEPGAISTSYFERAERLWIRNLQKQLFSREIQALNENKDLPRDSRLRKLIPYMDGRNIMRLDSRIIFHHRLIGRVYCLIIESLKEANIVSIAYGGTPLTSKACRNTSLPRGKGFSTTSGTS